MQSKVEPTINSEQQENQSGTTIVHKKPLLTIEAALNTVLMAGVVGGAVVTVGHPLRRFISSTVSGNPLWSKQMTFYAMIAALYVGGRAAFTGSITRGTVNASARKSHEQHLEELEEGAMPKGRASTFHLASAAFFETILTKYLETKASINSFGLEYPTTYRNVKTTYRYGAGSTLSGNFISFYAAISMHKKLTENMTFIPNEMFRHLTAGALCGAAATVLSFPFAGFYDYGITKMKVTKDGVLETPSSWSTFQYLANRCRTDFRGTIKEVFPNMSTQLGARVLRNSVTFSVIAGTLKVIGHQPYTDMVNAAKSNEKLNALQARCHGFFKPPKEATASDSNSVTPPKGP